MDQSTFNHGKSGDTNPKGRSRSPLLALYTRSLRNEREEKIGHRTSAACGGRLRLCYTLDEGKESERETTNCPPKRVRSTFHPDFDFINDCAYFDYQRKRVFVRTSKTLRKNRSRSQGAQLNRKLKVSRQVEITSSKCPSCGGLA